MNIEYTRDKFGFIDWQAVLETHLREYVVLFKEKKEEIERKYKLPFSDVQRAYQAKQIEIEDKYKLVLLDGWRMLAKLRGFDSVEYHDPVANYEYAAVSCRISWRPNETTGDGYAVFGARACAHFDNTYDFVQRYLAEVAENRSFVRAVRTYLGVRIYGQDEMSDKNDKPMAGKQDVQKSTPNIAAGPEKVLESKVVDGLGITSFSEFKAFLREDYSQNRSDSIIGGDHTKHEAWRGFEDYADIKPKREVTRILNRLKGYLEKNG